MTTAAPKLRSDLVMSRQGGFVVVKDPAAGRFFRFGEVDHFIASQFDGSTSVGEIRERPRQKFGAAPTPDVVEGFVATLGRLGLLETMEAGHAASAPQSRRLRGGLLHLRLSAFDPDPLLERLVGPVRLCFTPYFVGVSLLVILVALAIVIGRRAEIARDLGRLYRVEAVLLAGVAIVVVPAVDGFAHRPTRRRVGGRRLGVGFLLAYFPPAF